MPAGGQIPLSHLLPYLESFDRIGDSASGKNHLRSLERKTIAQMRRGVPLPVRKIAVGHPRIAVVGCRSRQNHLGQIIVFCHRNVLLRFGNGRLEDLQGLAFRICKSEQLLQPQDPILCLPRKRKGTKQQKTLKQEFHDLLHKKEKIYNTNH